MKAPLTQGELAAAMCAAPGCTNKGHHLKARCHPHSGLIVDFSHAKGALDISCKLCRKHVCDVAVATGGVQ